MTSYVHHVPGRLRFKSLRLKRNETESRAVQELLEAQAGVLSCVVNPVTGSVLVQYDAAGVGVEHIMEVLGERGYKVSLDAESSAHPPGRGKNPFDTHAIGRAFVGVLVEKVVERSAMALMGAVL